MYVFCLAIVVLSGVLKPTPIGYPSWTHVGRKLSCPPGRCFALAQNLHPMWQRQATLLMWRWCILWHVIVTTSGVSLIKYGVFDFHSNISFQGLFSSPVKIDSRRAMTMRLFVYFSVINMWREPSCHREAGGDCCSLKRTKLLSLRGFVGQTSYTRGHQITHFGWIKLQMYGNFEGFLYYNSI